MSTIKELEDLGYLKLSTIIDRIAEANGTPYGQGLVRSSLRSPMAKYRQQFVGEGLIIPVSEYGTMGMYDKKLLYFYAAYTVWVPPLSGTKCSAFQAERFREAFFVGMPWAIDKIPTKLRKEYDAESLVLESRPGRVGGVVVPLTRVS